MTEYRTLGSSPVQTAKAVYRNNVKSTPFMAERLETPKKYQIS